jgi:hypothetical protein
MYVEHILRLCGAPKSIVSNREPQFVTKFWQSFHKLMGTTLSYSTAFHPQTDGQTERVNQVLEDMLRACALTYGTDWESSLPLTALIGRAAYRLRGSLTTTAFKQVSEWHPLRPFEWQVSVRISQSCQKIYADKRRRELTFAVGDRVYLKVTPLRGTKRFLVEDHVWFEDRWMVASLCDE